MHGAIANKVTTANLLKCLPQGRPVIGVVVPQKCLVEWTLVNTSSGAVVASIEPGDLTNAGEILYHQENYSANKDSLGLNFGVAATFSIPLGSAYQDACLR